MSPNIARWMLLIPLFGMNGGLALAQGDKAVVVGTITDTTGAVIPGAEVSLTRVSTNEVFTALSSATGDYAIRGLVPDVYQLKVSMTGFKTDVRPNLKLEVGRTYRVDTQLSVGALTDTVEVHGAAPILKTESPELAQVIDNQKIMSLPLNNRDVFGALGSLTPGVMPSGGGTGGGLSFTVKGQRNSDNTATIDGSLVSETNAGLEFFVNPDSVQEFEIKTGLYGAEYGIKPGGQFSLVTKSGTNELHGTFYEFLRNNNLDARNFFDATRPQYKRNQFGAVAGGPIYLPKIFNGKDKAWWFFAYSGERVRQFLSLTGNVPTAAERAGQFSQTIIDPLTGQPFSNNTIPSNRIDTIAQKFIPYYPDPNTSGRGFNYTSSSSLNSDHDQVLAKIDFRTGPNSRWSGRFLFENTPHIRVYPINFFTKTDTLSNWAQNITNTRTIRNNLVNEFGFHWYRRPYNPGIDIAGPAGFGQSLGIPGWPNKEVDFNGIPVLSVTGLVPNGDHSIRGPVPEGNWEVKESASFTKGSHFFKMGYHYRFQYLFFGLQNRTAFSFTNDRYTGNAFANLLLGYLTQAAEGSESRMNTGEGGHYFYFQDNWKATPNLTVNLGLRYELRMGWRDKRGFLSNVDVPCANSKGATGSIIPDCYSPPIASSPAYPATGRFQEGVPILREARTGWQPRFGVSYRLTDKTVIRSGFGIYGNEAPGGVVYGALLGNPRANAGARVFISDPRFPTLPLSNPFQVSALVPGAALPSVGGFQYPFPNWYVPNWGLSIEQRLTENTMLEIGYQGSHSVHELQIIDYNDAVPGPGDRQGRRPFPQLQTYRFLAGNGNKNYNGLELKLEKRPGPEGLSTLLAYTWSKSLDTMGGRFIGGQDPTAISRNMTNKDNRGPGEADIPMRLALMLGYDIPLGPGRAHMNSGGVLAKIIGGWSTYGLLTLQKGLWFTVTDIDRLDVGSSSSQRPQLIGNPNLPADQRTPQQWFNTAAFTAPPQYKYGNAGRGIVEGPGFGNLDFSLMRNFRISESLNIQFRFEGFNITNHTNFNFPVSSYASPSFGTIGSAYPGRELQFGLKIYY